MSRTDASKAGGSTTALHAWISTGKARVFLVGVACVGKTTIGARLAEKLGIAFIDLDEEIEQTFGQGMGTIQRRFLTQYSFRVEAAQILKNVLAQHAEASLVLALPPSGLRDAYWRVVKKAGAVVIALVDRPVNIVARADFYDDDGKKLEVRLTERERRLHVEDTRKDIKYFNKSYVRAQLHVDLDGAGVEGSAEKIERELQRWAAARVEGA